MDLSDFREKLDRIDADLIRLLDERMSISKEIGEYKLANNLPVYDARRENEILGRVFDRAEYHKEAVVEVYKTILIESKKLQ